VTTATAPPAPPAPPPTPPAPTDRAEPRPSPARAERVAGVLAGLVALILIATGLIPIPAVVLSLPFVYLLARKPILRRLAFRNSARRPRETVLIIMGALLGTAIITSSYVVGDTLTSSIHRSAYTQLGPIDEAVLSIPTAGGEQVAQAVAQAHLTGVDGTLQLLAVQAAVSTSGPTPVAEPRAQVLETDFAQARTFGGDPSATGITGATPSGDNAAIGADLARTLGVKVGDRVTVYAFGNSRAFQIDRVLPRLGVAGVASFTTFTGSASPNLFVPPGTLAALQRSAPAGIQAAPPLSILAVSNVGNVTSGVKLTSSVDSQLVAAVHGLPAEVKDAKKDLVDAANAAGKGFTQLFQTFGYFSVVVGVLLLINIFVMLAQERKQTLGMLRAIGLRRASLVGSFSLEGWLYALASALAGMVVGVGIGRLVITAASRIFNQAGGRRATLSLQFSVTRHSLQSGFIFGFVVALATVVLTSLYVARLNVIRAIRDLPEPPNDGRRLSVVIVGALLTVAGLIMTVSGVTGNNAVLALVGPALLGAGLALLSLGRLPTRPTVTIISAAVIVWSIAAFGILKHAFDKAGIGVFFAQGVILNVFAVLLVTFNQGTIGAAIRSIGGGARNMSLRLGLAYPLAKRFRTGLLLAMYAIIVFVLVLLTTISHFFSGQINDQIAKIGGGAAVIVDSNPAEPVPVSGVQQVSDKVTLIAPTAAVTTDFRLGATGKFNPYTTVGYDESFVGHGSPTLHDWSPQYATGADAYRAVAADPTKIIVGSGFGTRNFGPGGGQVNLGAAVTMRDAVTGQTAQLTIVGVTNNSFYDGADHVFIARSLSDRMFGARSASDLLFVSTAPGTDNDALAGLINGRYVANGASATSFHRLVNDQFSVESQFLTLIRGYVALGLLVGIAGLGVVMVRSVRERRREVGVLRALGFSSVAVRRAFLAESSFIALEGILIGAALALITAWRLVNSGSFGSGTAFAVPWSQLAVLVVVTYIASLLATAAPAVQASRIRPAVALRTTD
jgi:putative ABC transport system permease protein